MLTIQIFLMFLLLSSGLGLFAADQGPIPASMFRPDGDENYDDLIVGNRHRLLPRAVSEEERLRKLHEALVRPDIKKEQKESEE